MAMVRLSRTFKPVARVAGYPLFIMTGAATKAKDLQAVPGGGSMAHLACAAFSSAASIELLVVSYKSTGMAKHPLITNEVDVGCMSAEGTWRFVTLHGRRSI